MTEYKHIKARVKYFSTTSYPDITPDIYDELVGIADALLRMVEMRNDTIRCQVGEITELEAIESRIQRAVEWAETISKITVLPLKGSSIAEELTNILTGKEE